MSEPFIGEIRMFPYTFAPLNWANCFGQTVPVNQYQALYAIIGNTFGGTLNQTIGLPNLQGNIPVGVGQGPNLSNYSWGSKGGGASVTLTSAQMPSHNHSAQMVKQAATTNSASGNYFNHVVEMTDSGSFIHYSYETGISPDSTMAPLLPVGAPGPHENRQPYLALRFCIALQGFFPQRS